MKWLMVFAVALLLAACSSSIDYDRHIFEETYSMELESTMVNLIHTDTTVDTKFGNEYRQWYCHVRHMPIDAYRTEVGFEYLDINTLYDHYLKSAKAFYPEEYGQYEFLSERSTVINGLPCTIHELTSEVNDISFHYKIAYYISNARIYEVQVWTTENRLDRFNTGMDRIINSFREI